MDETSAPGSTTPAPTRRWHSRADLVTAACPFCVTMLSDGVAQRRQERHAHGATVEVPDIAEVLLRSVRPDLAAAGAASTPPS